MIAAKSYFDLLFCRRVLHLWELIGTSNWITLNHVVFNSQVASSLPFGYAQGAAPRNDNGRKQREEEAVSKDYFLPLPQRHKDTEA